MQSLIDHARTFPAKIADRQEEFERLARGQQPQALFISCSDSRVIPSMFTGARPGDIFELRTAGNIVPRYRPQAACGVAGSLEFALQALQVPDIVVCGHSHCGAVQGLMREQNVRTMPLLRRWLSWAEYRASGNEPWQTQGLGEDPTAVAQQHVLTQLEHLRSYPYVARRITSGRLRLHAWFYTVETGEVLACAPGSRTFKPL
ncbi:carbonic anhydrase [Streptomyces diastatochromogenes]|uniref:Carbonic anhydrase n=1 Tax=Streptomyces diastatochromogenes TaxID=42236 RepID=A0A233S9P4_STRDA|nr:carbonic anhydrase [Streptomyces diastatochromogenes]MCZ0990945.1 carbonic anhydrase [Streptomyces diastatochromogenes]OXY92407.1 carbonic anhydrase [Streptomyces diastatochromogenes]